MRCFCLIAETLLDIFFQVQRIPLRSNQMLACDSADKWRVCCALS